MTLFVKTTAVFVSISTLLGILFHDMYLDRAASVALGITAGTAIAGTVAAESLLKKGHAHTHVHGVEAPKRHSVRSMPMLQTPRDDTKRNTVKKAHLHFGADNGVIWPSV